VNLRRKTRDDAPAPVVLEKEGGKGRATPSRKDANASRPVGPYTRTKVSGGGYTGRGDRTSAKAQRRAQFERQRAALKAGDQSNLPPRDAGPERALVRDIVDCRVGGVLSYFVVIAVVSLVFAFMKSYTSQVLGSTLTLAYGIVAIGDAILLTRRCKRRVDEKFPQSRTKVKLYAVQRAILPRRYRLPPPRVQRGDKV
jgi:hypothetical protein